MELNEIIKPENLVYTKPKLLNDNPMYYHSSYYAPYYEPATQQFQLQDELKIGNYPLINAYVNFHLKQARFYIMAYNLSSKFVTPNYFSLPHYPLNSMVLKFGIAVTFND